MALHRERTRAHDRAIRVQKHHVHPESEAGVAYLRKPSPGEDTRLRSPERSTSLDLELCERARQWRSVRTSFDLQGSSPAEPTASAAITQAWRACASAAWAPDGRWMYFSADVGTGFHLWRQRTGDHEPEQITFGATEEEGIAVAPDGRSLVTSVGIAQRSVWLRDRLNDRQISLEGYAYFPLISADGQKCAFA
jgi:hypothetical protein